MRLPPSIDPSAFCHVMALQPPDDARALGGWAASAHARTHRRNERWFALAASDTRSSECMYARSDLDKGGLFDYCRGARAVRHAADRSGEREHHHLLVTHNHPYVHVICMSCTDMLLNSWMVHQRVFPRQARRQAISRIYLFNVFINNTLLVCV